MAGGSEVIDGPAGWDSQSVYFLGPENIILELIAREADSQLPGSSGARPSIISMSEVGLGVSDVPTAVEQLVQDLGVDPFPPQEEKFAPVGNHDGLLILVDQNRTWFPTKNLQPARGPLRVTINSALPAPASAADAPTHILEYDPAESTVPTVHPIGTQTSNRGR